MVHGLSHCSGGEISAVAVIIRKPTHGGNDGLLIDIHGFVQGLALSQGGGCGGGNEAGSAAVGVKVSLDDGFAIYG